MKTTGIRIAMGLGSTLLLSSVLLTGCTPDPPVATVSPIVETVPEPTPTPQWTSEEQAAIDAVYAYLETWTYMVQNLDSLSTSDDICTVAGDTSAEHTIVLMGEWK